MDIKKVTVLAPDGHRCVVKITPNITLLQILEEAAAKLGFNSDEYTLTHHNREVGLTQIFRFSGLPHNCLLEMAPSTTPRIAASVEICVQLEDGGRKQGTFVPLDNLWHVAEKLCGSQVSAYESPVALYMRQEICGQERMSSTTLKSLGILQGSALIRIIDRKPEELKTQANVYVAPTVKETPRDETEQPRKKKDTAGAGGTGAFALTKALMQTLNKNDKPVEQPKEKVDENATGAGATAATIEKPKYDWGTGSGRSMRDSSLDVKASPMDIADEDEEDAPEVHIIGERQAIVYCLDGAQKQLEDLPDSFYDITVHDLKIILRDLRKVSGGDNDEPLLTAKLREMEQEQIMLRKIGTYKFCVIRIKFPDRHVLQGVFKPIDKIADVLQFVQQFLLKPNEKYHLFIVPPKTVLNSEKTLLELDFVPTATVHFAYDNVNPSAVDTETYLKPELLQRLTSFEGALYTAHKARQQRRRSASQDRDATAAQSNAAYESKSPGPSTGAIPKRSPNTKE